MNRTLAIMFTMTTYGTWLRGDRRNWVDDGVVLPPDPILEKNDEQRMAHEAFRFDDDDWWAIGNWIGASLVERLRLRVGAMTVQPWHVHFVAAATEHPVSAIAKCAKDAVRWGLRIDRPIWTDGYDKRFCFDDDAVNARVNYVERHNTERGRPAKPWDFIETW
ncbi:MAG: hypothetical protein WD875_06225 [Pirellulales bacterium]